MRVCLIYDCLFPHTVGGAERWYRSLAEGLAAEGHDVTYLTLRQWPRGERAEVAGVRVLTAGPRMALYVDGRRRIAPPLVFGVGVAWHLVRRGRHYDVVHTCAFPYFSLLAAALVRPLGRYRLITDWFEVWSAEYWRGYLGRTGRVGVWVQRLCARVPQQAFCFSRLHAERLREEGLREAPTVLRGLFAGDGGLSAPLPAEPEVVFAGRLIPEKRAPAVVAAVMAAARRVPSLRGVVLGDGPEYARVLREIERRGAAERVRAPGFVSSEEAAATLSRALCLLLPSEREGYGLIVVEASAAGVPSVVVAGPDNAATELIEQGVNGFIAPNAAPEVLADAILAAHAGGPGLRERTLRWFEAHADELALDTSLRAVLEAYVRV
jgi:glycosyltransferase involved in cell wall biosynthesis